MPLQLCSCLSEVKSCLIKSIAEFYNDLNLERLTVIRPSKEIFLCGGVISTEQKAKRKSVRDYIYKILQRSNRLGANIILAEAANEIYRVADYRDLISFEEDVAKLVSLIVLIAESPGSLAELGAFASIDYIRRKLRVIVKQQHADEISFIRSDPIERLRRDNDTFVGFFPWRTNASGLPVVRSLSPHRAQIIGFIKDHINRVHPLKRFFGCVRRRG